MHALRALLTLATLLSTSLATPVSSTNLTLSHLSTANLTLANGTSQSLTAEEERSATSGTCQISGFHWFSNVEGFVKMTLEDWTGKTLYTDSCSRHVCPWALPGMGDFLVTIRGNGGALSFYRQGTVSTDSWSIQDSRCTITKQTLQYRDFVCTFACKAYTSTFSFPFIT